LELPRRAAVTHGWSVGDRDESVFSSLNPQEGAISNAYQNYDTYKLCSKNLVRCLSRQHLNQRTLTLKIITVIKISI